MINIGTQAPDFKLQNQDGNWVSLDDLNAQRPLLVVFYPGDFTPVCTRQLCAYEEVYDRFLKYGLDIVGISPSSVEDHVKFKERYHFSFDLLSDPKKEVIKKFGVTSLFLLGGISRGVFVLAKGGTVLYRHVEATPITHRKPGELLGAIDALFQQKKLS